ncbi:hypothetical protein ASPNIDRAFT_45833 [Aspergillus niger ATCC 1015]|uniref:Uncharacterized protein n=1 Tax=Aspergillus niger (strain ATCC 1015 / CBS 113.46 / FGSC A1144 / LSHB Ac4 / NCTC 3858a / NRRL 328 / USDA 3528.7) TaxID=380704 RepID=G3Y7Z8_ASPNA|nr:hypothetical protein ASPNIDRAFT_45833 [Aspergillus niger ATCC 1015]
MAAISRRRYAICGVGGAPPPMGFVSLPGFSWNLFIDKSQEAEIRRKICVGSQAMKAYAIGWRIVPRTNRPPGSEFPTPQPPVRFALDSRTNCDEGFNVTKQNGAGFQNQLIQKSEIHLAMWIDPSIIKSPMMYAVFWFTP